MKTEINTKLMTFISAPDFSDNSRGFWEYVDRETDYETFWVVRDRATMERMQGRGIACAMEGSPEAEEKIRTAGFLLTSSFDWAEPGNKEQVHVTLWHGFPLKKIGFFESAAGAGSDFDALKVWTTRTDLLVATSALSQLTLGGMFAMDPRKVRVTGYPRNDLMFQYDGRAELAKLLGAEIAGSRLIFYLPTMRKGLKEEGDAFHDNFFNYPDYDAAAIDTFLKERNAYIVAKVHFADNDKYSSGDFRLPERLILLDTEKMNEELLTIYHIMGAFDQLITDYSSVYADYILLDRPIVFSCPDMESYAKDRGFVVDDPTLLMPGTLVKNQAELLKTLGDNFDQPRREQELRSGSMSLFQRYPDGGASERLLKEMEEIAADPGHWKADAAKNMSGAFLNPDSSLAPYTKELPVEIYVDYGEGMLEKDKQTFVFDVEESNEIRICLDLPASAGTLRMDPGDFVHWGIKDLHMNMNGKDLPFGAPGGKEAPGWIFFDTPDPWVIVMLPEAEAKHVEITFTVGEQLLYAPVILQQLQRQQNISAHQERMLHDLQEEHKRLSTELAKARHAEMELEQMKNSTSWKMTQPLRSLKHAKNAPKTASAKEEKKGNPGRSPRTPGRKK